MNKLLIVTILFLGVFGDTQSFTDCSYLSCLATGAVKQSSATRQTNQCLNGYYWAGQSCQPCQPIAGGYYKCTSYWGTDSLQCYTGYTQINNICVAMPNGCTSYSLNSQSNAYVCGKCDTGFTLISGVCVNNRQCATYSSTHFLCSSCNPGYFLNWALEPGQSEATATYYNTFDSFCSPCQITGCIDCPSYYTCKTCGAGYFWSFSSISSTTSLTGSGTCQSCIDQCSSCTSSSTCTACNDGYFLNNSGTTVTCSPCLPTPNCAKCSNGTSCSQCAAGYVLIGSTTCAPLTEGCTAMDQSLNCTTCTTSYVLNTQTPKGCSACGAGCQTCTWSGTQAQCTACFDLYYLQKDTNSGSTTCSLCSAYPGGTGWLRCQGPNDSPSSPTVQATQCVDGYFLISVTTNGVSVTQCVNAVPQQACLTVTNTSTSTNNICATCVPTFGQYQNGTCISCPPQAGAKTQLSAQCNKCTGSATTDIQCSGCSAGYFLQQATSATQATCAQCGIGCITCDSAINCTSCGSGYYQTGTSGSQVCTACKQNCAKCDANNCTSCADGFFLYSGNKTAQAVCVACQVGCATCVAPGNVCSTCSDGYVLQSGGCVSLYQANCARQLSTADKPITSSGCGICSYGFYMLSNKCFQSVQPYAGFVYGVASDSTATNDVPVYGQVLLVTILTLILAQ